MFAVAALRSALQRSYDSRLTACGRRQPALQSRPRTTLSRGLRIAWLPRPVRTWRRKSQRPGRAGARAVIVGRRAGRRHRGSEAPPTSALRGDSACPSRSQKPRGSLAPTSSITKPQTKLVTGPKFHLRHARTPAGPRRHCSFPKLRTTRSRSSADESRGRCGTALYLRPPAALPPEVQRRVQSAADRRKAARPRPHHAAQWLLYLDDVRAAQWTLAIWNDPSRAPLRPAPGLGPRMG